MKNLIIGFFSLFVLFSCNNSSDEPNNSADTLQQMLSLVRDSIKSNPENPEYRIRLVTILESAGKYNEALQQVDSLINAPGRFIPPRLLVNYLAKKAEILEQLKDTLNEIKTLEEFVRPGEITDASMRLGYLYAETKNKNTIALCDAMIRNDDTEADPVPHYLKGVYFYNTGDLRESISQFDISIRKDYTFIDAYMEKGRALYHLDKFKEAVDVYDLALKVSPAFADAFYWKARCQEKLGMNDEAKLNYQRAYALDKTLTEARDALDKL